MKGHGQGGQPSSGTERHTGPDVPCTHEKTCAIYPLGTRARDKRSLPKQDGSSEGYEDPQAHIHAVSSLATINLNRKVI